MNKKTLFALTLLSTLSFNAFGICPKSNPQDAFEIDRTIVIDRRAECLDTRARSIRFLLESEARQYVQQYSDQNYYIANLHHNGEFWIGEIPKNGVNDLIIQEEIFMDLWITKAAHVQMRFNFGANTPVKLYNQKIAQPKSSAVSLSGFALSFEALGYENGPAFGLLETMGNPFKDNDVDFQLVSRVISLSDTHQDFVVNKKHKVRQFLLDSLKINPNHVLQIGLNRASQNFRMKEKYDLLLRNCTNVAFEIMDKAKKNQRDVFDRSVTAYPALTIDALKARKIFKKELTEMAKEKASYIIHHN